jgi:hypothetical protein
MSKHAGSIFIDFIRNDASTGKVAIIMVQTGFLHQFDDLGRFRTL